MKSELTKLKIGEFSKMMQVTVKTLRHYEQMGLLLPAEVDEWTGYRYYTLEQMQRLGCKCSPSGYCFTIEHNKEYSPTDIDIEYCEQVEEMGTDSAIIKFKQLPKTDKAVCMKHYGPYDRFYESYTKVFKYIEEQGYLIAGNPRTVYVDGIWNQEDPEKWLSIIQVPVETKVDDR